jgi:hypothetical protein
MISNLEDCIPFYNSAKPNEVKRLAKGLQDLLKNYNIKLNPGITAEYKVYFNDKDIVIEPPRKVLGVIPKMINKKNKIIFYEDPFLELIISKQKYIIKMRREWQKEN